MLKRTSFLVLLCFLGLTVFSQNVTVTGALVGDGSYATLGAAFTAINGGAQTGATISIAIVNNTTETATALLNAGTWTSISIQPSGGAWTISSNLGTAATIEYAGADNVTIDGLNSGGNALTILNSSTGGSGTSTIRMGGDASNNVLTRLNLQGSGVMAVGTNGGVVFLSTAASGGSGNDNNIISFCNIGPVGTALPSKGIYSNGTQTAPANYNSGNQVLNCNIFDVFAAGNSSASIYLANGSSDWTISGNRFYQTATRTQTTGSVHANIQTAGTNASAGHTISGNTIGYASSAGTGTYTIVGNSSSSRYYPINIAGITAGNPTTVTNNVISNISFSGNISGTNTTCPFSGIHFNNTSGMLGTISGNLIGSMVADSSILITTSSTSTGEYYGIFFWPGASHNLIGNQVGGFTVTGSSSVIVGGIRMNTGSAAANVIQNNVIGSLAAPFIINSLGTSTRAYGILSESGTPTITGNSIGFLGHPGGSISTSVGSYPLAGIISDNSTAAGNTTIAGNTIHTLASLNPTVAATAAGIVYNGQTTGTNIISNNSVGNISLQTTNAAASLNGILVTGGNTSFVNNMVRLGHDASGAALVNGYQVNGITETSGSNNYYHNSVYVGGTGVGGSANTFAFSSTVTTNTRNFVNNIFFNARSNGAGTGKHYAIRVGGTAPAPAGLNSNFNDLFVNGTGGFIGLFNGVDQPTLAAWRTATGVDVSSISGNPGYLNPTGNSLLGDLHIGPAPTVIEAAGTPLPSVTTDFDNQVRASFSPVDLGADAGNFLLQDISGPSITYTPLLYTCATGDRTFTATITDGTGVPTSGGLVPRVYFRKNAGAWFSTPGTLASGTGQNGTWNLTISAAAMGGIVAGDAIQYYVIAQDNAAPINISSNPAAGLVATDVNTVTTPPTTPGTYTVNMALSGTYTVGTTGAFATLTAAVNAYNVSCLTGPVTFSLIDATYPTETFPINILANPDASAVNTLTIKPAAGVTPLISGSSAVAILRLTGADYVTIDGSNTIAGTTRDLTIANTNTGTTSLVIWVGTPSASNTVINPVIKNCNVRGNTPSTTGAGIMLSSGVTAGGIAEADIPNAQIVNNAITASYYGVGMFGGAAFQTNALISGNTIGSATAANKIGFSGITAAQQQNHTISDNTVFGVTFGGTTSPNCSGIALTGTQSGGNVVRNTIYDVKNTNTTGYGAYGILLSSGSTGINMTIANNFISDIAGVGFNGTGINDNGLGICVNNGTGYRIWHNTVLMNTNQTATGSITAAFYVTSTIAAGAIDLRDNILVNNQTVGSNRYAVQVTGTSNNVFSNINYNDYFSAGPNLSTVNSTNQATLAALQTALGGNANSVNIAPVFAGAPDLHLPAASNPLLDNLGNPIGVTTDIDLQPRSNLRPDLGADEFGAVGPEIAVAGNNTLIVDGDVTPSTADFTDFGSVQACSGTLTRTFTIGNTGNDTLRISSVVVTGTGFTLTTAPAILNLPPFAITTFVVTFDPAATGLSSGTVTVNSNDADEALYDFAIQGTGDADVTAPVAVCQNLTVQLNAAGSATIVAASVDNGSTDLCGITGLSVSPSTFSCANLGANNVTLTATDAAGNAGTCTATVTVADTIRPIAVCQSATIFLDAAGSATLAASQVNGGSSDNCGAPNLSVNPSAFTCANLGVNTVTLTASDAASNTATCTATVTVVDSIDPVASCMAATLVLDAAGTATLTTAMINNGSSDNCGAPVLSLSHTNFTCAESGNNTVTLTAMDASGNIGTCTANVSVQDTTSPTALCQNISLVLNGAGTASIIPTDLNNGSSDNCGGALVFMASATSFTCANVGANNVTLTVTDPSANSATCTAIVTITDTVAPVASCQAATVTLDAAGNGTLAASAIDNGSSDNCGSVTLTASPTAFTCADLGSNSVTLTVTDGSGNASTCTAAVTVVDTMTPVVTCMPATIYLDGAGSVTLNPAQINNGSTDNCAILTTAISKAFFLCSDLGTNTVTLTLTDASGNSASCNAVVTVADTISPIAVCQNITVNLNASGTATVTAASLNGGSTDNCSIASLSVAPSTFTCANVGINNVTLTATDGGGNSSTCVATVTVIDNIAPTALCFTVVNVNLDATGMVTLSTATLDSGSTDNCGPVMLSVSPATYTCADLGSNISTLTVSDASGNTSTCQTGVIVSDNTAPFAACHDTSATLGGGGTATITPAMIDDGSTDACGIDTMFISQDVFACADVGPNTVTLTVTDVNGNTSTCTAIVTINANDIVPPVAICQDISLVLGAGGTVTINATALDNGSTDNCGIAGFAATPTTLTCANIGMTSVILTVTDGGGNTDTCTAIVTLTDPTAPVAVCQNVTVNLDAAGNGSTTAAAVNNGSSDNCGITSLSLSQTSFTCADLGANTVILTVTDASANTATCTATVNVVDTIAPSAICQNLGVSLDAAGNASTTAAAVNNGSTDNCSIASTTLSQTSFTCANLGSNTVTLTVTDGSGNTATCTAVVTVTDTTAPTAICRNIGVNLDAAGNATVTAASVDNGSTDNCAVASLSLSQTSFTCAEIGVNSVTLTVTDASGNSSTCTASVTVSDSLAPNAVCQNVTVSLDATGNATATAAAVNNGSTDNCAVSAISLSPTSFTCANLGANNVTLTVLDASGNMGTCTAIVTVTDTTAPTAICRNIGVNLDAAGNATVTAASVDNGSTDNCAVASLSLSQTSFTCAEIGVNSVTLTVTDASGNSSTCTASVTVSDSLAPNAVCQNVTVSLDATGNATATAAAVNNGSTDNCAVSAISLSPTSFTCANLGANTVTLTVLDASGNMGTCTAIVTVTDTIAPTAICQNITVSLDAAGTATASAAAVDNGSTDNCAIATLSLSQASFTCANLGTNIVTLTATDASGNSGTCTATITVIDAIAPTAVCQNLGVNLDAAGIATVAAAAVNNGSTDNCAITTLSLSPSSFTCADIGVNSVTLTVTDASGNSSTCTATVTVSDSLAPNAVCQNVSVALDAAGMATVTATTVDNGSSDNCAISTISLSPTSFTCANLGANTATLTVFDASGNSSTCTATIIVTDTVAPTAICQNITVSLDAAGTATATASAVDNGSTDNCAVATLSLSPSTFTCANLGANTVTLTAADASGNSGTCTATITVTDAIAPAAVCQNITVSLDATGNATATAAAVNNGSTDNCAVTTLSLSPSNFTCADLGANTVTLTATDASGNSGTCTAVVTVTDAIAPTAICQNITVSLDATGNATATAGSVDNGSTDNCAVTTLSLSQTSFTCANLGANTVTLTATDASGNSGTCTAVVTVTDAIAPAAICQNISVSLDAAGTATATPAAVDNGSTDNCAVVSLALSQTGFTCANLGANTVTLTATDASGNSGTCTAIVTVIDAIAPTVVCHDTTIVLNPSGSTTLPISAMVASSSDNCGIDTVTASQDTWSCGPAGVTAVTITVTDASGNSSTCIANVTTTTTPLAGTLAPSTFNCGNNVSCNGATDGSITTTVAGGCEPYAYAWSNGASSQDLTGIGAGIYTVTITDAGGNIDIQTITLLEPAALAAQVVAIDSVCAGSSDGSIDVDVTGGNDCVAYSYLWSTGDTTQDLTGLSAGTYTLTVTDASGCTTTITVTVGTHPAPVPVITETGGVLTCAPAFPSYQWNLAGTAIPGATGASYTPTITGTYTVTVIDSNGCSGTSDTLLVTGVKAGFDRLLGVQLYPNPARGEFKLNVDAPISLGLHVTVTDMYGKQVKRVTLAQLTQETAFDIQDLAQGSYLVEVLTLEGQRAVFRLVVQ